MFAHAYCVGLQYIADKVEKSLYGLIFFKDTQEMFAWYLSSLFS